MNMCWGKFALHLYEFCKRMEIFNGRTVDFILRNAYFKAIILISFFPLFWQLYITSTMQSEASPQDDSDVANSGYLPVVQETGGGASQCPPKPNGGRASIPGRSLLSSPRESYSFHVMPRPPSSPKEFPKNIDEGSGALSQFNENIKDQHVGGRRIRTVQMDFMKPIGLSTDAELRVMRTIPGEQADTKGIRPGMRVVAGGGYVVSSERQLRLAVAEYRRRTSSECAVVFLQEYPAA